MVEASVEHYGILSNSNFPFSFWLTNRSLVDGITFFHSTSVEQLRPVNLRGHWVKMGLPGIMPFNPGHEDSLEN